MLQLAIDKPCAQRKQTSFRKFRGIDLDSFKDDLSKLSVCDLQVDNSTSPDELLSMYNTAMCGLVDEHAPKITKYVSRRPRCPWYNDELHQMKLDKRRKEHKWHQTKLEVDHQEYRAKCKEYNQLLRMAKISFLMNESLLVEKIKRRSSRLANNSLEIRESRYFQHTVLHLT